ncbi:hypothetical protein BHE74_00008594 [Ensete ventricosum]|nr:hypothetical protein BHE74_00008594 [Ensete ventricosum]
MKSPRCVAATLVRHLRPISETGFSASTARFHGSFRSFTLLLTAVKEEFLAPEMRPRRRPDLVHLGVLLGFLLLCYRAGASIHEYSSGAFTPRSNSFFFHGGSEGLYASAQVNITAPSFDGDSFIHYAYSEDTNDDFDDEGVSLTGSGARGIGDNLSKLERKERKNMDHVFGIGNDVEEDKRE